MSANDDLRAAFDEAAAEHDVDVTAMYVATRLRLSEARADRSHKRETARTVLLAAAAVVVVTGIAVGSPTIADRLFADETTSPAGEVDNGFTCPVQATTDFATSRDDSFLPELSGDGVPVWEEQAPALHAVEQSGSTALLRVGNADGTLASITTFERRGAGYRRVSVTKCVNEQPTGAEPPPLVGNDLPETSSLLRPRDVAPDAVVIADRLTYDVAGLVKRIRILAYECDDRLCLEAGSRGGTVLRSRLPSTLRPVDLTQLLADPDDVVGVEPAQRLVAVHDRDGALAEVSWRDRAGGRTVVTPITVTGRSGRLFLVLAPTEALASVSIVDATGQRVDVAAVDLRD